MQRVDDLLRAAAARHRDKTAFVCGETRLSYRELQQQSDRAAAGLRQLGVVRGDRVVLWLPTGAELVVAIFATLKAGAAFVVADASSKPDRIDYVFTDSGARVLLASETGGDDIPYATNYQELLASTGTVPNCDHIDRDLACLVYTSGSSGPPKGVMSAHQNVVFAVHSIRTCLGLRSDDVVLSALPLSFDYGLYQLLMVVACGATLVCEPFTFPAQFLERLTEERATILPGVPTMWAMLLGMRLEAFDMSSLRSLTNTGAAIPEAHIQRLQAALPGAQLFSMYGLTETKRTLCLPPEQIAHRPGSVGIAIPGTEVWLEDDKGQRVGANEVGELIVRGGHVMLGYWNAPAATAERFVDGPLPGERLCRTGDLFRRDEAGYYYFVSRRDDMLKSRGQKVSPKEVEDVLHELPTIQEAAVVGEADEVLGSAIVAYVQTRDDEHNARKVTRHCRSRLEDFKVPDRIVFVDALPKTSNGKIDRQRLTTPPA